jgi:hypothetical protein
MSIKKTPEPLTTKVRDSDERKEKIEQRLETISNFEDLEEKAIDKIEKMCINSMQIEFLSVKDD